ncbi:MAG: Mrp/NBP35 family ATP-binding protein [Syntrophales bacterium]
MSAEEEIIKGLEKVLVPGTEYNLVNLNLVRHIAISDGKVDIVLASAALNKEARNWIKAQVSEINEKIPGVRETIISFVEAKPEQINEIQRVVAVMSGKGGVGKSLVTGLIALSLARRGHKVGILDADITGPSIPRMFGVTARPLGSDTGILPVLSRVGIEIMSINLLLSNEDDAVIWQGSAIAGTIKQFWEEVLWGRLDYLLVDLPPGTSDASLTVMQSLPLSEVIIVFSPQDLTIMVVRKAVQMIKKMDIPILGVVENMSYFLLPDSGKRIDLFGSSKGQEMSRTTGAPLLGQIPVDPELAGLCDEGSLELYDSVVLQTFAENVVQALSVVRSMKKA